LLATGNNRSVQASRFVVLVVAIVMVAWFLLGALQAHDISRATNIVSQSGPVTAAQAAQVSSLLSFAGTLNPDQEVNILRASLAASRNNSVSATRILLKVGREEPSNLEAWDLLAQLAGGDSKLELLALKHIAELDPRARSSS
jgi:hypothetical protein